MKNEDFSLSEEDETLAICHLDNFNYRSILGTYVLFPGNRYYFEVKCLQGKSFKIGVATIKCSMDKGFSDSENGWAYDSCGSIRHNST
jgi:hypothetical protein